LPKRFRTRNVILVYLAVLALLLALGCSTKQEPAEVLELCGNHSCGELVMVTVDTSSDGYQYLDPAISPDGMQIAFTADWSVIPSVPDYDGEPILDRQILLLPVPDDLWSDALKTRRPVPSIQMLGGELVRLETFQSLVRRPNNPIPVNALDITKGNPVWLTENQLLIKARFSRRDRFLVVNVANPSSCPSRVLFYESDDLLTTGGFIWYHDDPAISPDGRWLAYTRFGCDADPNFEDANCTGESIWVLDMWTASAPEDTNAIVTFPVTSASAGISGPTWSPDGRTIAFSSTTDLVGDFGGTKTEIFRVDFDPGEAAGGAVALDSNLQRLTFTEVSEGDPIVGLQNYSPVFDAGGNEIYFVSSRRTPGSTLRIRSLWRVPSDGRLEPALLFFSRYDDVDPAINRQTGDLLLCSRMGFPSSQLDAIEAQTIDFLTNVYNDTASIPLTEVEIQRRASDEREELQFFEDVMSQLYMFRGF
jgi:hypothetical protein